jgi:hypothetical protein
MWMPKSWMPRRIAWLSNLYFAQVSPSEEKAQVPPLRSGRDDNSVGPSTAICLTAFGAFSKQQNCHPDRSAPGFPATQHSPAATCAAFSEESRIKFANASNLNRKSGVAQWRDLRFLFRFSRFIPATRLIPEYAPHSASIPSTRFPIVPWQESSGR